MSQRLLLCTDLDRTLVPNGPDPESPRARNVFRNLVARPEVTLVYVTGRDRARVEHAIDQYRLPIPDHVVADVGTTIYEVTTARVWRRNLRWEKQIAADWANHDHDSLAHELADMDELQLQEASRQNRFKLSYYVSRDIDADALSRNVGSRLDRVGIRCSVVYSVDDLRNVGLLDILPACATKLHSIEFIRSESGFKSAETVFCGDSGNDLSVLASYIPGVLVANASAEVRSKAIELARLQDNENALYIARGSFAGLNGNYAAGILEGVAHFCPAARRWIAASLAEATDA